MASTGMGRDSIARRRRSSACAAPILVLFLGSIALPMFAAGKGALKILVQKPDGTSLDAGLRASVRVWSATEINSSLSTRTDNIGAAYFYKLAPGIFTIQVEVDGFQKSLLRTDVKTDQVSMVRVALKALSPITVSVEDVFDTLDPTSAATGLTVKQDLIFSVPIGDRISDKALFVPGVYLSPVPGGFFTGARGDPGDPALMASVARDLRGQNSYSNNTYLLDGIDIADPLSGRGRTNFMDDLIADMEIKTGGVSAEYQAKSGIFCNVTTISGGNEFHGGASATWAPESLRAAARPGRPAIEQDSSAAGFHVEGPLAKDRAWFVVSAESVLDHGRIALPDGVGSHPGEVRPFSLNDEQRLFGKLTWQIDPVHRLIGEFHSNWKKGDNADDLTLVTPWLTRFRTGGDRSLLWYSFQKPWLIADVKVSRSRERLDNSDLVPGQVGLILESTDPLTPNQSQFGGSGNVWQDLVTVRNDVRVDFLVPLTSGASSHILKFGFQDQRTASSGTFGGSDFYHDLANPFTAAELVSNNLTYLAYFSGGLMDTINASPTLKALFIKPGETAVTLADLDGYRFDTPDPNHPGAFLGQRSHMTSDAPAATQRWQSDGFYFQDYMTWGNLTFSPGLRMDNYRIISDQGSTIWSEARTLAPRVGLVWDPVGDARSKFYGYFGRYFNPMFGSSILSATQTIGLGYSYQMWIADQWLDMYVSNPSGQASMVFQNQMKMPYTDELRAGFDHIHKSAGSASTFSIAATYRQDKKIIEGLDPNTYGSATTMGDLAKDYWKDSLGSGTSTGQAARLLQDIQSLAFPMSDFAGGGFTGQQNADHATQVFVNMPGARRTYAEVDLSWKLESPRTLFFISGSWVDAEGTCVEIGEMTPNGYGPTTDPRLPWMHGHIEGSLDWLVKAYGSYLFQSGFNLGMFVRVDSGFHYTRAQQGGAGALLPDVPTDLNQLQNFHLGGNMTPRQVNFDLHLEQRLRLPHQTQLWLSANVFNLFNNQNGVALAEGINIRPGFAPGQPYIFNRPRSVTLGAKLRF